jgi:hypothetical protein
MQKNRVDIEMDLIIRNGERKFVPFWSVEDWSKMTAIECS